MMLLFFPLPLFRTPNRQHVTIGQAKVFSSSLFISFSENCSRKLTAEDSGQFSSNQAGGEGFLCVSNAAKAKKVLLSSPKQKRGNKGVVSQWTSFFLVPSPRPRDFVPPSLLLVPNVTLPLLSDCCSSGPRAEQRKLFFQPLRRLFLASVASNCACPRPATSFPEKGH